jgi:hypothetical protein
VVFPPYFHALTMPSSCLETFAKPPKLGKSEMAIYLFTIFYHL